MLCRPFDEIGRIHFCFENLLNDQAGSFGRKSHRIESLERQLFKGKGCFEKVRTKSKEMINLEGARHGGSVRASHQAAQGSIKFNLISCEAHEPWSML